MYQFEWTIGQVYLVGFWESLHLGFRVDHPIQGHDADMYALRPYGLYGTA
jgi:hypothetical protein